MYLENIYSPADVKKLPVKELNELSDEIRVSLLQKLSEHGGHFGPNFGMVEATIALHYVFNSPKDKIVFDVSHQSYVHKMLTGRKTLFFIRKNTISCPVIPNHKKANMIFCYRSYFHFCQSGQRIG